MREGYCIHFASAFALMARTLGMPSRIVVGYLPGSATSDAIDRETVYSVSSGQLHAWPEVMFEGIGWVPFEPTNGLGVPTSFSAAGSAPGGADDPAAATPAPTSSASAGPGLSPEELEAGQNGGEAGATGGTVNPLPALTIMLGILFALAIPGLLRELRRRQMLTAARSGDAAAAWLAVQDAAIDLGIDVPASETPRALGTRLVAMHGAPAAEMSLLISSIERASYAPGRQACVLAGRCDRGCGRHRARCAARLGRHPAPSAGASRAPLADRSAGQRLRRFGSDRARKVGWSAAREGHGGFA